MSVAKKIKEIIQAKGVSGAHIERALGKHSHWFCLITTNRTALKADDVKKIADLLAVDVGVFFEPLVGEEEESTNI